MNLLKHTEINDEINRYFQIDGTWEFENVEPVKSMFIEMRKTADQLFQSMVAAKEGAYHENLHGAIQGLKKELTAQREKIVHAIQREKEKQTEGERKLAESKRREAEVELAKEANLIAKNANTIATDAKEISDNSLFWARIAIGVSILAALIPIALHFKETDRLEKEVTKQINAEYREQIIAEVTKNVSINLSESQKEEIDRLIKSDSEIRSQIADLKNEIDRKINSLGRKVPKRKK